MVFEKLGECKMPMRRNNKFPGDLGIMINKGI
jgi:hypothetical protein